MGLSATARGLAVLFATAFNGPARRMLVVALAVIAAVTFVLLLIVGFQYAGSWWRNRRRQEPVIPVPAAGHQSDAEGRMALLDRPLNRSACLPEKAGRCVRAYRLVSGAGSGLCRQSCRSEAIPMGRDGRSDAM